MIEQQLNECKNKIKDNLAEIQRLNEALKQSQSKSEADSVAAVKAQNAELSNVVKKLRLELNDLLAKNEDTERKIANQTKHVAKLGELEATLQKLDQEHATLKVKLAEEAEKCCKNNSRINVRSYKMKSFIF